MPEQLIPNIYDVLQSANCSRFLSRLLRDALSDGRELGHAARDARVAAALLEGHAQLACGNVITADGAEPHASLVDLALPLEADAGASARQVQRGNVVAIEFPNTAWHADPKLGA